MKKEYLESLTLCSFINQRDNALGRHVIPGMNAPCVEGIIPVQDVLEVGNRNQARRMKFEAQSQMGSKGTSSKGELGNIS